MQTLNMYFLFIVIYLVQSPYKLEYTELMTLAVQMRMYLCDQEICPQQR